MPRQYRIENDIIIKTRPKFGSKRYNRLSMIARPFSKCEIFGTILLNPHSIVIHQGKVCQAKQ